MNNYGKVKQFPIDEELIPLSEEQMANSDEADDIRCFVGCSYAEPTRGI